MDEIRILSPTAILGYGFPESSFQAGAAQAINRDLISGAPCAGTPQSGSSSW
jgi:hypothetical protein